MVGKRLEPIPLMTFRCYEYYDSIKAISICIFFFPIGGSLWMTRLDVTPANKVGSPTQLTTLNYIKMVETINGTAHANEAFWQLEASIILYGLG